MANQKWKYRFSQFGHLVSSNTGQYAIAVAKNARTLAITAVK